jgi:hypothetical protein
VNEPILGDNNCITVIKRWFIVYYIFLCFFYQGYLKGSEERTKLEDALQYRQSTCEEIPIIINGKEYWTDNVHYQTMV